jgi:chromosome segregation protein
LLKLKRVELQGFKSFCERTEMRFHGDGIAAIVGPNGCGKSNLSDGISWVLGEQSAKSLRGTRMEDVIFAGTRDRKPLGMAQVTMTLVDPEGGSAAQAVGHGAGGTKGHETNGNGAYGNGSGGDGFGEHGEADKAAKRWPSEITITRRLYRSGDSEYLIDGKLARLRDIQDIFLGTGLGPESYAIIEQGRIGQLLSSRPQDRRAVIEEAAGISKFKTRRRLAEAKLESAKQNLSRVFDILEEVGRQANSLKRQAAKARRYKELREELITSLRVALAGKFRMLEREASRVALELNEATAEFQQQVERVSGQEAEQRKWQEQAYATESELTAAREELAGLRLEAERIRGRIESQAAQAGSIGARLEQGETDAAGLETAWTRLAGELEAHGRVVAELEHVTAEARTMLEEKSRERDRAQAELRNRESAIEMARQMVLRLLGESSTIKNQLGQMEAYLGSLERDRGRLAKEEQMAAAEVARLESRKAELSEALSSRQMELESTAERKRRVEADLAGRKTALAETRKAHDEMRAEASRLKARKDSLEEILSHHAYTTESVKGLFTACEHGQVSELSPLGVLADFVEVETSYEKAAESFLHDELEYVLVKNWAQAETGIDVMRTDLDGRVTFLVHPEPGDAMAGSAAAEPAIGPETGIVSRLSEVLRMTNGLTRAPAALLPRLLRCFIADDRGSAQRLARQYPDYYFLTSDGVCYHGHAVSGGRQTGSGPLALKRELRELTAQSAARQTALDQAAARLETLDRELHTLGEELEKLRGEQQGQEREALALDHEIRKLGEEFARASSRISVVRLELERIGKESQRVTAEREERILVWERKEQERTAQEEALAAIRGEMESFQDALHRVSEEHSVLRVRLAEREERRRSEHAAKARLEQQAAEVAARRENLLREMNQLGQARARLLADNVESERRAGELQGSVESLVSEVDRLAALETSQREALVALDESLKQARAAVQAAQEKRSQIEMALVERRAELKFLEETARKELNAGLAEIAVGLEEAPDEVALVEAEAKVAALRARIENLGAVNTDALQEYEEAQRRYDFLNTQRQDLLDSIRDTEKAIQEIDVESRRRFSEAFEAINANFKETFTKLFGGGVAEMRLTDETNANDSGIDIVASPPGKRLQNVLLLSGGEKALTALALLMAIFRYTPSPFCILDEVDAPLDEPNIQRLMNLLKEMADKSQFIIITHAKRTMEAASSLYGVTMQEPGVSRLVAVKFNQPDPEPAPRRQLALASA